MAANASVAAARLGAIVDYWGSVGNDALGERIVSSLKAEGVQTAAIRRIAGARSPCTALFVDERGERLICTYNDPALDADATWLPIASLVNVDAVLADVRWPAGAARALGAARAAGVPPCSTAMSLQRLRCASCARVATTPSSLSPAYVLPAALQQSVKGCAGCRRLPVAWSA
jgi:sugar/nucleoside kinase (ribokinase family)